VVTEVDASPPFHALVSLFSSHAWCLWERREAALARSLYLPSIFFRSPLTSRLRRGSVGSRTTVFLFVLLLLAPVESTRPRQAVARYGFALGWLLFAGWRRVEESQLLGLLTRRIARHRMAREQAKRVTWRRSSIRFALRPSWTIDKITAAPPGRSEPHLRVLEVPSLASIRRHWEDRPDI
jgi:hypothetical protein